MSLLFSKTTLGPLSLQNRIVMAPMTRSRAIGNIPNDLMATYYAQRASAGLIVTEGTSPSPNGLGYARIPGIFDHAQLAGWKKVTDAVHAEGGKIFVQLMHTGRVSHALNLPAGARAIGPSAIAAVGEMWTDTEQMKSLPTPEPMSESDIKAAISEYVQAAQNAMTAGFDGIELHGANGYLIEQFIRPTSNQRTDNYGGSLENRARFLMDVVTATVAAIGKDRVGVRLSPFGVFNDMPDYPEQAADYAYIVEQLNVSGLVYLHLVDHSSMGAPTVPASIKAVFRKSFTRTLILSGGYDAAGAESDLTAGNGDLIAVGRPLLANPDLVQRWQDGAALNAADMDTFYTPGPKGYTDYPVEATTPA
ncbi:GTN Reductase [Asticcacaulis biprosthecium C19]|uniref:GTN Reductase n=1 Tax=Asticcacaulis biprosthecium C19 TaxID=715226 RepID=F4QGH1_9CAUL|nr:alkene reductase [Asticcacaulis biprosthecium]EGF93652.1 GTN Reductase [Asticcacaulis biprosthecium C19]